jgi:hypothetical protein
LIVRQSSLQPRRVSENDMVAQITTVAFEGIEAVSVEVQVQPSPIISRARKSCRGPNRRCGRVGRFCRIWPMSAGRKPPSARSRSQPPAAGAKGYSALQLSRDLSIDYKTAFVMLHKVREAIKLARNEGALSGDVAVDGAYFGGYVKPANLKSDRKDRRFTANQSSLLAKPTGAPSRTLRVMKPMALRSSPPTSGTARPSTLTRHPIGTSWRHISR